MNSIKATRWRKLRGILMQIWGSNNNCSQRQQRFQKFRTRNYSLSDELRPGRPVEFDENVLQRLVEQNIIVEDQSENLTIQLFINTWVPYEMSGIWVNGFLMKTPILIACRAWMWSLLCCYVSQINCDENWILYKNVNRQRRNTAILIWRHSPA